MRRCFLIVVGVLGLGLAAWFGTWAFGEWQFRTSFARRRPNSTPGDTAMPGSGWRDWLEIGLTWSRSTTGWDLRDERGPTSRGPRGLGPRTRMNRPRRPRPHWRAPAGHRPQPVRTRRIQSQARHSRASRGERRSLAAAGPRLLGDGPARPYRRLLQRDVERTVDPSEILRTFLEPGPRPLPGRCDDPGARQGQTVRARG